MAVEFFALALLQSAPCGALATVEPPESGDFFIYETHIDGEPLGMVMGVQVVTSTGLATSFRQGGGLTADSIQMSTGTPVRGYGGVAFPRSLGSGDQQREWSYSPSPEDVLARLQPGETAEIFVSERSAGAGERYTASLSFDRCDTLALADANFPANVYRITRVNGEAVDTREIWLSSETGWWLVEILPDQQMTTRLIEAGGQ